MRTNVRIGNDIKLMWQILDGGVPVNLTNATDIKVSIAQGGIPSCNKIEITTFEVTDAVNGMIEVEVQKEVITKLGYLWTILEYTVPDSSMIDGNRKITVDNVPVRIVAVTAEASQDSEFTVSSDIQAGFQGLSAYEVWLKDNPDKTKEDYYNWLQKPATDIAETVNLQEQARVEAEGLRVLAEELRQTNTATAISNAEEATLNANTAAQNADNARLAIQDDLALKANHGYGEGEEPKTLKQVEDYASVKIENLIINGGFENPDLTNWSPAAFRKRYDIAKTGLKSIGVVNSGGTFYTQYGYTEIPTVIGNIYYTSAWCYVVVASPNNRLSKYNAGGFASGVSSTYNNSLLNEWQNNSILFTATAESTRILNGDTASTSAAREVYYDNVITIDLTTAFGAGNEPTKDEMDLLISTLGIDYFEGEITIPAQKIMQWQLALIRKNKNAIIALGGTII
ncbi:MAG: hypothetical protein PHV07_08855 [Oscillospiraceae bacterium]|nr:hypothetical protein [Oscillospiraceae bacterium]